MQNDDLFYYTMECFERKEYDETVKLLIYLYDQQYKREQIIDFLYDCFIQPNVLEFEKNFKEQIRGISKEKYENTLLDFIPITEERYYVFMRQERAFLGVFDYNEYQYKEEKKNGESILIADKWDLRDIFSIILNGQYCAIYLCLNQYKDLFYSFLKLPNIKEKFLKNVIIFDNDDLMIRIFEKCSNIYLPHILQSNNNEYYEKILRELHEKRICQKNNEENIFLSICIPSYNRGDICLKNVMHLLDSIYDIEIEIVVSNNGSTIGAERYKAISELKDTRIKYLEFEENQGYASNVLNVIKHASGTWIAMCSDEDFMNIGKLNELINFLYSNLQASIVFTSGEGMNFMHFEYQETPVGIASVIEGLNSNYVTGLVYNNIYLRNYNIIKTIEDNRGNTFVEYYTHCAIATVAAQYGSVWKTPICLWTNKYEGERSDNKKTGMLSYMTYGSRVEQMETAIQFVLKTIGLNEDGKVTIILERIQKTFYLLYLAYLYYWDECCISKEWIECCIELRNEVQKYIQEAEVSAESRDVLKQTIDNCFWSYYEKLTELDYKENIQKNKLFIEAAKYLNQCGIEVQKISQKKVIDGIRELYFN